MKERESFDDVTVSDPLSACRLHEDRENAGEWRVEYFGIYGRCYVTIFGGPGAERRARDYFDALRTGRLK